MRWTSARKWLLILTSGGFLLQTVSCGQQFQFALVNSLASVMAGLVAALFEGLITSSIRV